MSGTPGTNPDRYNSFSFFYFKFCTLTSDRGAKVQLQVMGRAKNKRLANANQSK